MPATPSACYAVGKERAHGDIMSMDNPYLLIMFVRACARVFARKNLNFYIHYVHFVTTFCVSACKRVNIAVNIVNIERSQQQPTPNPSQREGSAIRKTILRTVRDASFHLSQWVGLFVPTAGTVCPNGWDKCRKVFVRLGSLFGWRSPPFGRGWGWAVAVTFLCSLCSLLCSLSYVLIYSGL